MVNEELNKIIEQQRSSGFKADDDRIHIETRNARNVLMRGLVHFCGEETQWLPEYEEVAEWLADNKSRGLLCYGNCGRGKSLICQKILPIIFQNWHGLIMNVVSMTEISNKFNSISDKKIISLDDVGTESIANQYGEKHDYFRELVDLAERKQKMLVITTNLSLAEIKQRYGDRTIDRLHALTTTVLFKGKSLRK